MGSESVREGLKKAAMAIFRAGVRAVDPEDCINRRLRRTADILWVDQVAYDLAGINKLYVVGAGKAVAAMSLAVERLLGERIDDEVVITKYGHGRPLQRCRLLEAGHPVPDENGLRAAEALLNLLATDGTDGPTEAAGAFADGTTVLRAQALGISAVRHLVDNDSYTFFAPLGDLLVTGPTRINVMDLQIVLIPR